MLRISEIKLDLDCDFNDIETEVVKILKIQRKRLLKTEIYKQSVDCRKDEVKFVYTVDVTVDGDEEKIAMSLDSGKVKVCEKYTYTMPQSNRKSTLPHLY